MRAQGMRAQGWGKAVSALMKAVPALLAVSSACALPLDFKSAASVSLHKCAAGQAKWKRLAKKWSTIFLLDPADAKKGTWLDSAWSKGLAVGCKCCKAAGDDGPFGRYAIQTCGQLQAIKFQRHQQSEKHKVAASRKGTQTSANPEGNE